MGGHLLTNDEFSILMEGNKAKIERDNLEVENKQLKTEIAVLNALLADKNKKGKRLKRDNKIMETALLYVWNRAIPGYRNSILKYGKNKGLSDYYVYKALLMVGKVVDATDICMEKF